MSAALVAALVVVVLAAKSGDVHGVPVRQTESVEPSEFLVKVSCSSCPDFKQFCLSDCRHG